MGSLDSFLVNQKEFISLHLLFKFAGFFKNLTFFKN